MIGIKCQMDEDNKKVYVVVVFGGYDSFNIGVNKKKELVVLFNIKFKKFGFLDQKLCKNCDKWKNYDVFQKGLIVENGKIYLIYVNMKDLKCILKKLKDGLVVDVV